MQKPRKLSSTEVAALVGDLMEQDASEEGDFLDGREVRPFELGANDLSGFGDYHALRMINERFCRIARAAFLPLLHFQPRISSFPPELRSFDDYRNGQDNFVSLTVTRIEELRGSHLMVLPPSFIALLTDAYYGGPAKPIKLDRTEFTATEQRVIEVVTDRLNDALKHAWRDLMSLRFEVTSREENMQFLSFVDGDDLILNCSFMVQMPDLEPASFDILYPLQMLKPIARQLRSRTQSDSVDEDQLWRERLERAIMSIPLRVSARLGQPKVQLHDLMQIHEGDTLPVDLSGAVDLLVEGRPMFAAEPGSRAGHAAVRISHRRDFQSN
jgi:flagellar motor switch protein FliM